MAGYIYSLIYENPLLRIYGNLKQPTGKHNSLTYLTILFLGSLSIIAIYLTGIPAGIQFVGKLLHWTVIAVLMSILAAICLAIFIVLVDFVFVALKLVDSFHFGNR